MHVPAFVPRGSLLLLYASIFNVSEFHNKNLHLKFPSIDWNEARLVGEGDPEWGMGYLGAPQLLPGLPCLST
ncbi:BZ3500_MvSof-1268-A1-R1_Chr5-2g07840 [Microbotryum saponariae]|uniref:BZ3500_MvSof-1268-A1-R1_Chr5-2g07840 protein n=1 Tax=Microbotryum saponariae TaxID=289078 RepID=A0A2X0LIP5_9BASI|nr:BZ3500_MvSof-1268-A1-R1_Chr5-2g07840 [Microbotryum saponariae]SDA05709.1 BZ3501_MvSof-1269-A2-R1_Chr5-2g07662 [Microbotryum saponariae]